MTWPETLKDTVIYSRREFIADQQQTLRMIDKAKAEFIGDVDLYGKIIVNGIPYSPPDRMDVRELGIVGDGSNEAVKFQAAVNLGIPLLVPYSLKISIGSQIILPNNTNIQIDGRIERTWNATGHLGALFKAGNTTTSVITYASNITITGSGTVGAVSQTVGSGFIFWLACHDLHIQDVSVDNYWGGLAFLIYGNRVRMNHVNVLNSSQVAGTGGIRYAGGEDFIALGCHVESGDDALQFVPPEFEPYTTIRRGAYIGCTGYSTLGRFIAVGTGGVGTTTIEDCSFIGCHGRAGIRAVTIQVTETVTGIIRRISVRDCSIWMNSVASATSTTGAVTIVNLSPNTQMYDITLDNVSILNPYSCALSIENVNNIVINNCLFEKDQVQYASFIICNSGVINDLVFTNNRVEGWGTSCIMNMSTSVGSQLKTRIENNEFTNFANNVNYCIQLGTVTDAVVRGNIFRSELGATTHIAAIRLVPTTIGARIERNDFSFLLAGIPISVANGTNVLALDNRGLSSVVGPITTAYTTTAIDARRTILMDPPGTRALNVNADTSASISIGEYIDILNINATGTVTITPIGVTVIGTLIINPLQSARLFKTAANTYYSTALSAPVAIAYLKPVTTVATVATTATLIQANTYIRFTGTSPTYTIPPNSSVAFPTGSEISGTSTAGTMTLIQGSGVILNKARTLVTTAAFSGWTAIKVATDEWDVHGDFV